MMDGSGFSDRVPLLPVRYETGLCVFGVEAGVMMRIP